jgi:hypothetical protein
MKTTNIQDRKLSIIDYLIKLNDNNVFSKIENIIEKSETKSFKKFTKKQLIERAQKSNNDIAKGNFSSQDKVKLLSKNW